MSIHIPTPDPTGQNWNRPYATPGGNPNITPYVDPTGGLYQANWDANRWQGPGLPPHLYQPTYPVFGNPSGSPVTDLNLYDRKGNYRGPIFGSVGGGSPVPSPTSTPTPTQQAQGNQNPPPPQPAPQPVPARNLNYGYAPTAAAAGAAPQAYARAAGPAQAIFNFGLPQVASSGQAYQAPPQPVPPPTAPAVNPLNAAIQNQVAAPSAPASVNFQQSFGQEGDWRRRLGQAQGQGGWS